MFRESSDDVGEMAEVVGSYINLLYCETIQAVKVKVFPKQKAWVDGTVKAALTGQTSTYNVGIISGDMTEYKVAAYGLRRTVKDAKRRYKDKVKADFNMGDPAQVGRGKDRETPFIVTGNDVRRVFKGVDGKKAAGPDQIPGRVLKFCANQLAPVYTKIFNTSLSQAVVPSCFKQSVVIPVPKKNTPPCMKDYRPVALTSAVGLRTETRFQ